jgi:hypothetical protein
MKASWIGFLKECFDVTKNVLINSKYSFWDSSPFRENGNTAIFPKW